MLRILFSCVVIPGLFLLSGCSKGGSSNNQGSSNTTNSLKYVALGDSLTHGVQSNGISENFQDNSYPLRIATQMGLASTFEQPLVANPGFQGSQFNPTLTPLTFTFPSVISASPLSAPVTLLNSGLTRSYDNLGISGTALVDIVNTTSSATNVHVDMVLRGLGTPLEQALSLNPTILSIWIGNNDVLGAATNGGDLSRLTALSVFESQYSNMISQLRSQSSALVVLGNIPNVTDIPFVNFLDRIFSPSPALGITTNVPVIFGTTLSPIDFGAGSGLFIPLLTQETNVIHVTLPALSQILNNGLGIPNEASLVALGIDSLTAQALVAGFISSGLTPSGIPLPGNLTITQSEQNVIVDRIIAFNAVITAVAATNFGMTVVDMNTALAQLRVQSIEGYTGRFVLIDPVDTGFSLDGVHTNNGGYAVVANIFIQRMNQAFGTNFPLGDTSVFRGQYVNPLSAPTLPLADAVAIAVSEVTQMFSTPSKKETPERKEN
jgi:lysophospholipase L1-like esterase